MELSGLNIVCLFANAVIVYTHAKKGAAWLQPPSQIEIKEKHTSVGRMTSAILHNSPFS